ncbi:MAG: AAA family ATPase [Epulopiscium sp.]|nr:AAA family ATPase [Candidatus Epulonipiscium sp.]
MLIRFNVGNFLSFNNIQEFSMISGDGKTKMDHIYNDGNIQLLKFAAIYGANAAGKSNLVESIDFAKEMIIHGFPKKHTIKYYKGHITNKNKPSYFEFELKINDNYYSYGFEIILNKSSIISEWLIELTPENIEKEIFTRDITQGIYSVDKYFKDPTIINKLTVYADDIKLDDSILFLHLMNQNKNTLYIENKELEILENIYNWMKNQLDINYPNRHISHYSYFMMNDYIDEISKIIAAFGTGITKFSIVDIPSEKIAQVLPQQLIQNIYSALEDKRSMNKKNNINEPISILLRDEQGLFIFEINNKDQVSYKSIKFNHGKNDVLFSLSEESDGTIRLLDLIEILFNRDKEKVYIIDEIDRCLHPQLTYKFIESYLSIAKERKVQLIVTTHESRLLDFDLLRRDEIWFVDKNTAGETNIYSLAEYNERFDQEIDHAYLEGRYGGVPIFKNIFPIKEEK